ncbi:MAG: ROK family protein [Rikenellaceae bacterium]
MVYIGLDLGGTKISGALFSETNNILLQETLLLERREGKDVTEMIFALCKKLFELGSIKAEDEKSIGICIPGIAYSKTGNVWAPNINGWENYPLRDELKRRFPRSQVIIESDRTCYILGETSQGIAKGCNNAVFMAVGTGIGAGILIDGRVLHGASDIVGATGWMALQPPYISDYDQCGCFETYASGKGIALQAKNLIKQNSGYKGVLSGIPVDNITAHEVFDALKSKDLIAEQVVDKAIEMWGMASANFVSLFNPEMVVFGGGVFGPAAGFIDRIYLEARKWAQPIAIKQCKFTVTQLPNLAGLYGAGVIAIHNSQNNVGIK